MQPLPLSRFLLDPFCPPQCFSPLSYAVRNCASLALNTLASLSVFRNEISRRNYSVTTTEFADKESLIIAG